MLLAILFDVYSHRFTCCCLTRLRLDAGRGRLASGGGCFHGCVFDELQLDLEIALSGVSAKIRPLGLFSPTEDKLKLSDDVIEDDFTSTPDSRIWDLSPMPLGAAQRRPGNRRNRRLNQRQFVELYFTRGSQPPIIARTAHTSLRTIRQIQITIRTTTGARKGITTLSRDSRAL